MKKNKLKLLYLITQGHWGGAQKYVFDLATALTDEYDITVAVGEPNNLPDLQKKLLTNQKIKLVQLNFLQRSISPIKDFLALLEINNLYRKIKPDIVHLNSTKAGILGSFACQMSNVKCQMLVYTVHGWVFNEPMNKFKKYIYKIMEGISSRRKDKIIVLSDNEKETGINLLNIKKDKFVIIPVGIESNITTLNRVNAINKINNTFKKNILKQDDYIIGTIANFYPTKNLSSLIEAINIVKNKLNNFHSIIIGEGEERVHLEFLIKKYNLENNIHLTGFIDNAQNLLKAFNVFVLPSKKEGIPYTIIEARINNIPIIATNVGSIYKIIDNMKTGILLEPENTQKLAEALIYAYENQKEMIAMANASKEQNLPEYLKNTMIIETANIYKNFTNKS
ncbi:MAG: hypothetical protein A2725_01260 [Candidatus Magasanikbacteria bacterium RIFCSPHIGHO2_01_FULL_33_34]|uniref:Glycosyltransferase subfamily 4-like N-terminal domain-containing protein n=1 Tax=Candidatus Magasanikbacteria bacterium RIFCSPHIGHO2_01_FULL_33_34 TaxID=1798671 RepID=A0A1F6LJ60_9BACT|nr:MAG: hypothetical protein A2725_01260 [Candidatus Magasanikbacteria bacterium RIFCSPHIGHO2_01_FULL_33_34]OGH65382.1 MAG: hypothetical protein A3B83_04920 [Candidatus Magasanikbacteria bacterium RIFCSPHIGHO2_02_FULL_33_17]OGH76158.1 MAG: hypothetical protein A3A89_01840 [Candidatus Magasanikbacteria bacterium RIFCSPLOWO2_01_FULL_33_34]